MGRRAWKEVRHWLYWVHRWLGIASCVLFAMWFASGVVMMYVPYPGQSDAERRARLAPVAWEKVHVAPARAVQAAGVAGAPRSVELSMLAGEPVYRMGAPEGAIHVVSAVDGRRIDGMTAEEAVALVRGQPGGAQARLIDTRERDQWSVPQRYNPHRPLHLLSLEDGRGGEAYVSSRTGEVVLETDAAQRFWNWLGAVPHWIYFTPLRKDGPLWANVVLWVSGLGIAVAVTGVWIGILRARLGTARYSRGRVSPYRGWMLWHHISGLIGGIAVITFIVSGWLSLNPGNTFSSGAFSRPALAAYAGDDGRAFPGNPAAWAASDGHGRQAVEASFLWFAGRPLVLLADAASNLRLKDAVGREVALDDAAIADAAARLMPGTPVSAVKRLTRDDAYWYSHHHRRPLPVVRVEFSDDAATWAHIDPATSRVVGRSTWDRRLYRWLYNGLHSLDFRVLLEHRPLWDVTVLVLSAFGMIISVSGIVIGWRRLRR